MSDAVIHLYTVCWDEADMLGFFFRHYDPWVDRYVIYDDGSTDGSVDILAAHPKVELRRLDRVHAESFVLSQKAMQDDAWKESRHSADWIVITAIDEHLHVPGRAMREYLAEQQDQGTTVIPALGFDLNHAEMPDDHGLLVQRVTHGRARAAFNKLSVFRPHALRETGFGPGRHQAEPIGDLRLPQRDELLLWHYKHLGFERNATREARQAERLGRIDHEHGYGQHYLWALERLRAFWDEMQRESTDLSGPGFDPLEACVRPLWWEERRNIIRLSPVASMPAKEALRRRAAAMAAREPVVSVLVKAYNHAPYVRQTIQSLLEQEGPDFEIVVTDDGSTDGTREILEGFDDPRIRLLALPDNQGISAAMNATVPRARGRYLAILNSDDWALPGRLARQAAFLDEHPAISLVFGLPRTVDEFGEDTRAFNDFATPLGFADFSRRSWLRYFFFHCNVLCAPTAMIRRQAFTDAGPYDPRLFNLQDLDMWIRMLVAGHRIHLLDEPLTAFRIRDAMANASAPRPDNVARSTWENAHLLRHFAAFDEELFQEVFGEETSAAIGDAGDGSVTDAVDDGGADKPDSEPVALRVARLALTVPTIDQRYFALQLFWEHARVPAQFAELIALGGRIDALNVLAVRDRDLAIAQLQRHAAALDERIGALSSTAAAADEREANLREDLARQASEVAGLAAALADREARLRELDVNWHSLRRLIPRTARMASARVRRSAAERWRRVMG